MLPAEVETLDAVVPAVLEDVVEDLGEDAGVHQVTGHRDLGGMRSSAHRAEVRGATDRLSAGRPARTTSRSATPPRRRRRRRRPVPHAGDEHRHPAGDRRDPQHQAEVGGQPQHARRPDEQQAGRHDQHRVQRGGGRGRDRRRGRRLEVLVRAVEHGRLVRGGAGRPTAVRSPPGGPAPPRRRPRCAPTPRPRRDHGGRRPARGPVRDGGRPPPVRRRRAARARPPRRGPPPGGPGRRRAGPAVGWGGRPCACTGRRLPRAPGRRRCRPPAGRRAGARRRAGRRRAAGSTGWRRGRCRGGRGHAARSRRPTGGSRRDPGPGHVAPPRGLPAESGTATCSRIQSTEPSKITGASLSRVATW